MVDFPNLDLNPFNDNEDTDKEKDTQHYRALGYQWNGKGKPPSRDVAIGYLALHGNMSATAAKQWVGQKGTLTEAGERVREALQERAARERANIQVQAAQEAESAKQGEPGTDVNSDGTVSATEQALGIPEDELSSLIAGGPGEAGDTRGAPLWRYEGTPEMLDTLEVENKSWYDKSVQRAKRGWAAGSQEKTGARYYQQDTLGPLKWSPEQRADLQRVLHGIGLYGDAKVKLGSWTARDQAVYAELLASANEEGLTWYEMLTQWKRHPPEDLLAELEESGAVSKRPPIQVSNPLDIMAAAKGVSLNLTGEVDRGFVEGTVRPYQGVETAAQNAAYDAGEAGSGATIAAPPSVDAFADDKLRRENPIEVDGYQFVNQFQSLMSMLGVQ